MIIWYKKNGKWPTNFSSFSISVVEFTRIEKTSDRVDYRVSKKVRVGATSSVRDISHWRRPGNLQERFG